MRLGQVERNTLETQIKVKVALDGTGKTQINTGIGFFDHMLTLLGKHAFLDLEIEAQGDLAVDYHHTVEDVGIALGLALKEALGNKQGIKRYGTAFLPMDESLAMASLDISNRPYLVFDVAFTGELIGSFPTELIEEFWRAVAFQAGLTLHLKLLYGSNNHHIAEALFKALAKALGEAVSFDKRIKGVMSTKGLL